MVKKKIVMRCEYILGKKWKDMDLVKGWEKVWRSDDISEKLLLSQDLKNSTVKIYEYERARLTGELRYKSAAALGVIEYKQCV